MASTSPRYDDLNALFINCTLKRSPELSHTLWGARSLPGL